MLCCVVLYCVVLCCVVLCCVVVILWSCHVNVLICTYPSWLELATGSLLQSLRPVSKTSKASSSEAMESVSDPSVVPFTMCLLNGDRVNGRNLSDAIHTLQVSRPADLQFRITRIDDIIQVTVMPGFNTLAVRRIMDPDAEDTDDLVFEAEIPRTLPAPWVMEDYAAKDRVMWNSAPIPGSMALPIQCSECLTFTTWFGAIMNRWAVSPSLTMGEDQLDSWDDFGPGFTVRRDGFIEVPGMCGLCTCHACSPIEEKFVFHCARCHFPMFADDDAMQDPNTRFQLTDDGQEHGQELWCCTCSIKHSGNFTGC